MRKGRKLVLDLIQNMDGAVLLWIQASVRQAVLDPLVCVYTTLGNGGLLWIVLSLVLLCFRPTRRAGLVSLLAMVLGLLCTNVVLKHLVARPRPWLDVAGLIPLVSEPDPNSFPSGHTCAAFASALAWWRTAPKGWMKGTGVVLAVCMGLSRLYVGVHYPSDVLAGALVGSLCGLAAVQLYQWIRKKRRQR